MDRTKEPTKNEKGKWYEKGAKYWGKVPATVNGMLGGFAKVSKSDLWQSKAFLMQIKCPNGSALDCGAGIGRVTQGLLLPYFQKAVDTVEQDPRFVATLAAKKLSLAPKLRNCYCFGLQHFQFEFQYDCIWIQWVTGMLQDADLVSLLQRCKLALLPGGFIVLKDNILRTLLVEDDKAEYDPKDASVTRSDACLRRLFTEAGTRLVHSRLQQAFPKELLPVRMYALQGIENTHFRI